MRLNYLRRSNMSAGVLRAMLEKEKNEFRKFVSLVKRMREAQNRVDMLAGGEDIEFVDMLCIEQRETEREVDEYLKKME